MLTTDLQFRTTKVPIRQFIDQRQHSPDSIPPTTMLSNPTTSLHARQRAHRRQNSTPSALEAVKIQHLPTVQPASRHQQHAGLGHRRGLSLDTRRSALMTPHSPTTTRQDFTTVSTTTNLGLATQHHVLREAQQQRIQARPGPIPQAYTNNDHENGYLISPHGTPQTQRFADASCFDPAAVPFDQYPPRYHQVQFDGAMGGSKDFELFSSDSALSTPTFVSFSDAPGSAQGWISEGDTSSTRRTSRRISNGIMDRVAKFESMGMDEVQRPLTPPHQNATSMSIITPQTRCRS
jgi:regulatory protein SWI5